MFKTVSEREIFEAVKAVRDTLRENYDKAQRHNLPWLNAGYSYPKAMSSLQANMTRVFDNNHRPMRLLVTEIVLGIKGLDVTSFNDLFPAERFALQAGFEAFDNFDLVLEAISMAPARWKARLNAEIPEVVRPKPPELWSDEMEPPPESPDESLFVRGLFDDDEW